LKGKERGLLAGGFANVKRNLNQENTASDFIGYNQKIKINKQTSSCHK
jgi:hypothetical protein